MDYKGYWRNAAGIYAVKACKRPLARRLALYEGAPAMVRLISRLCYKLAALA